LFVNLHQVILQKKKKKKKISLLQNKLYFFDNFLIIRSKEPYLGYHPCMWNHDISLPWHMCVKSCLLKLCSKGWHFAMLAKVTWQGEPNF
jgi:hypothetical protein